MEHKIYHSKQFKTLLVIPKMGTGIMVSDHVIQIMPVLFLNDRLNAHKDSFTELETVDL